MAHRMEIELTSQQGEQWTWRAAGARQPKGTVDGSLLYDGAAVGDVVRADVESDLDGILVLTVLPPKEKRPEKHERLEILGSGRGGDGGVTTSLVKGRRRRDDDDDGGDRRGRGGRRGDRRGGRDGERGRGGDRRGGRDGGGREGGGRSDRGDRGDRGPRRERRQRDDQPARPKAKRIRPGRTHRRAWLDTLPDEQKVVAEQLSRGGIAAVRKEIDAQNARAREQGTPEVNGEPLVALAESLLPKLQVAEWQDRADAAVADLDELDLRDLRSVVVAADDFAKGNESREVAQQLRDGLTRRVEAAHEEWLAEIAQAIDDDRVVRALRVSSRPPKAGSPLPPDLQQRLADVSTLAFADENLGQQRLAVLLEALAFSPVRLSVAVPPAPANPSDELLVAVRKVASRLPEVAKAYGVSAKSGGRRGGRGRKRPSGDGSPKPPPPPPPPPPTTAESAEAASATEAPATAESAEAAPATEASAPAESVEPAPAAEAPAPAESAEAAPAAESAEASPAGVTSGVAASEPAPDDGTETPAEG